MELTERDYAEAFGVELPEDTSAETGEPETAQEGAESAQPDTADGGDGQGESGSGGAEEGTQEVPDQPQDPEERRRQAHGRRQRELEAARQAARDAAYEEMFRGQKNTDTPIRTEADYRAYRDAMSRQDAEAGLRRAGVDPQLIRGMVEEELRPLREQTRRQELSAIGEQARMVSSQADAAIRQAMDTIRQMYGGTAQSMEDILAMPTGEAFRGYIQKGLSLEDAYYMANRADIDKQRMAAARQAGVNQARGKGHMANPAPAAGPAAYQATPEEARAYREFMPDATDKEINAAYAGYHKNQ